MIDITETTAPPLVLSVAGIDEAGRGPLAGPVTAAAVVLPPRYKNPRITDSKLLHSTKRDALYDEILRDAVSYSCASVGPRRIDRLNIRVATRLAMELAVKRITKSLGHDPHLLIDGNMRLELNLSQETIIKGDLKILAIGAASIVAKVTRDRLMERLEARYPGYNFAKHKGYGTEEHRTQIARLGPCAAHRFTFAGVREHLSRSARPDPSSASVATPLPLTETTA